MTTAEAAIHHGSGADGRIPAAAERMFTALRTPSTQAGSGTVRLPVCAICRRHWTMRAPRQPGPVGELADAFAAIEPQLNWTISAAGRAVPERPRQRDIIGAGRAEIGREMLPHRRQPHGAAYPDHLGTSLAAVASSNPPDIVHAMRSAEPAGTLVPLDSTGQRLILEGPRAVMCMPPDNG